MGFLSFLFGKKKEPTVSISKAPDPYGDIFTAVFEAHIKDLGCFSHEEIKEMLFILSDRRPSNVALWEAPIYTRFFKDKDWQWKDLDRLRKVLSEFEGLEKSEFWWVFKDTSADSVFEEIINGMKAAGKKQALSTMGVDFDKKIKSDDAAELLKKNISKVSVLLEGDADIKKQFSKIMKERRRLPYERFVSHMQMAATNLFNAKTAQQIGAAWEYKFSSPMVEEVARRMGGGKMPPFFPDDRTVVTINKSKKRR